MNIPSFISIYGVWMDWKYVGKTIFAKLLTAKCPTKKYYVQWLISYIVTIISWNFVMDTWNLGEELLRASPPDRAYAKQSI